VDCLGSDDVVRDVIIELFSAWSMPSLYGKPRRLFKVICQQSKKSACEDLACDLKTLCAL
jgi:hypothetical protein